MTEQIQYVIQTGIFGCMCGLIVWIVSRQIYISHKREYRFDLRDKEDRLQEKIEELMSMQYSVKFQEKQIRLLEEQLEEERAMRQGIYR